MKSIIFLAGGSTVINVAVWLESIRIGHPWRLGLLMFSSLIGWLLMGLLVFAYFIARPGERRRFWAFCGYGKRAAVLATVVYVVCWPIVVEDEFVKR